MRRTRIKICGIRSLDIAQVAVESGADALGFVFADSSPRYIEPAKASLIVKDLPPFVTTVGLTVNARPEEAERARRESQTQILQLHGDESVESALPVPAPIVKALRFDAASIHEQLDQWQRSPNVRALLIDGSAGGMGASFDWSAFEALKERSTLLLILAGGLTPENVGEAIRIAQPEAVDVSSGVESSRGVKDAKLIRAFCDAVRMADASLG